MGLFRKVFLAAVGLFFLLPNIIVFIMSFTSSTALIFPPKGFTLQWYYVALTSEWFLKGITNSLTAASFCTLLSIPVGVFASYGLLRYRIRARDVIQIYLLLPFTVPLIVQGISLLFTYVRTGVYGNLLGIGFALMEINIPFMIWSVTSAINRLDPNLEYASMSLGAEEVQTFFRVILPALMPGVLSGALLMFILGLNEFITSLMLVTIDIQTLPVALYTRIRTTISPDTAAAGTIYLILAVITVYALDKIVGLKNYLR